MEMKVGNPMTALNLAFQILLIIGAGYLIRKLSLVDDRFDESLTSFIMNIALPCLIIKSLCVEFTLELLGSCIELVIATAIMWAVFMLIGQIAYYGFGKSATGRLVRFSSVYPNFTFVGLPVAEALYGDTGLFYFTVLTVPIRLVYYSTAPSMLKAGEKEKKPLIQRVKGFFSPAIVSVIVGIVFFLTGLRFPDPVGKAVYSMAGATTPLGLVLCGMNMARLGFSGMLKRPRALLTPLFRNIIAPAVMLAVLLPLPFDHMVKKTVMVYAMLPCAALMTAFTIKNDPDVNSHIESSIGVCVSTLISMVTMPLWTAIIEVVF